MKSGFIDKPTYQRKRGKYKDNNNNIKFFENSDLINISEM